MSDPRPDHEFPTTHWSIIARLKSPDDREATSALKEVFTTYRYPLYGYLRSTGLNHEDAEDVLHGFFEKVLRLDSLRQADQERGRLRSFLRVSVSRYRITWQRGESRRQKHVSAEAHLWEEDEARYEQGLASYQAETPEHFYDRQWAVELVERVQKRLRRHYEKRGKPELYTTLAPLLINDPSPTGVFADLAAKFGLAENALRVSLHRLRKEFREVLLEEVKRTLDEGEDPRVEIQHLLRIFQ